MRFLLALFIVIVSSNVVAQPEPLVRGRSVRSGADGAEMAVQRAAEQLERMVPSYERDVKVLAHLREAQEALSDAMQPRTSIEKAYEHVGKAKGLLGGSAGIVFQSILEAHAALESARRSPGSADFDRLRGLVFRAMLPAARVTAKNALDLEERILDWIRVQQLVSNHLRRMSEIAGDSLRASQ